MSYSANPREQFPGYANVQTDAGDEVRCAHFFAQFRGWILVAALPDVLAVSAMNPLLLKRFASCSSLGVKPNIGISGGLPVWLSNFFTDTLNKTPTKVEIVVWLTPEYGSQTLPVAPARAGRFVDGAGRPVSLKFIAPSLASASATPRIPARRCARGLRRSGTTLAVRRLVSSRSGRPPETLVPDRLAAGMAGLRPQNRHFAWAKTARGPRLVNFGSPSPAAVSLGRNAPPGAAPWTGLPHLDGTQTH